MSRFGQRWRQGGGGEQTPLTAVASLELNATELVLTAGGNVAPEATIVAPEDGFSLRFGDTLALRAVVTDEEDGELTGDAVTWASDLAGPLGTGTVVFITNDGSLAVGSHQITVEGTDSGSMTGAASIFLTIEAAPVDEIPVVVITSPAIDGQTFTHGSTLQLRATATDAEDGVLVPSWSSDLEGPLGTGDLDLVVGVDIVAGSHVFTASAVDSIEQVGTATRTATMGPAPSGASVDFELTVRWGRQVKFHDLSVDDPTNPITAVNVYWGHAWRDGTEAYDRLHLLLPNYPGQAERYQDHVYPEDGEYTVRLVRTYADGTTGTRTRSTGALSAPATVPAYPVARVFEHNGVTRDLFPGRHPAHATVAQPDAYLDTTPPDTTGWTTYPVTGSASLTAALASIAADPLNRGVIELSAGFAVTNYVWPARPLVNGRMPENAGWIVVTQADADRPEGFPAPYTRIRRDVGLELPRFRTSNATEHAIDLDTGGAGIYKIRFVGVHLCPLDSFQRFRETGGSLVRTHSDSRSVVFDRCYWRGPTGQTAFTRGWHLYGFDHAAVDCWFEEFKAIGGTDTQAIYITSGHRTKIVNNYGMAAGEVIMSGGAATRLGNDPEIPYQMGDLEVRLNHFHIPHRWRERSFEFADDAEVIPGCEALTVTAWDPVTRRITLDAGTPHNRIGDSAWSISASAQKQTLARIVGGPRDGSWARVNSAPSTTTLGAPLLGGDAGVHNNFYLGVPQAGDTIELLYKFRWTPKNRTEWKNASRVEYSCNVLENGWAADDIGGQLSMINTKVEPQTVASNLFAATRDINMQWNVLLNGYLAFAVDHHSRADGALFARRLHIANTLVIAGDPDRTAHNFGYGGAGNTQQPYMLRMDWATLYNLTFVNFLYAWGYFSSKGQGPTSDLDCLTLKRIVAPHGREGCQQADQYISYATADIADLLTYRSTPTSTIPSATSLPGSTALATVVTDTDPGFANPTRNLWGMLDPEDDPADYSMLPASPGEGKGFTPAEWAFLMAATEGVRAPVDLVPFEWEPPV